MTRYIVLKVIVTDGIRYVIRRDSLNRATIPTIFAVSEVAALTKIRHRDLLAHITASFEGLEAMQLDISPWIREQVRAQGQKRRSRKA